MKTKTNLKATLLWLAALVTCGSAGTVAATEKWDMPAAYSAKNFITSGYIDFAETVTKNSNGDLEIIVHPAGSLYKGSEIMRAVRTGQVQIGGRYLGAHAGEDSIFGIDTLPFIATSVSEARQLYKLSRPALEKALEKRGMKLLFTAPWPAQGLFHRKEVKGIDDMSGTKFRAYDKNTSRLAQLMGATPTKTEATEISQAFSTGVADSMIGSGAIGVFQKLWDYVDYFYTVNAWIPKSGVIVNLESWNALTPETQSVVLAAARETETRLWDQVESVTQAYNKTLADNGMKVLEPSKELQGALVKIGRKVSQEWGESASADSKAVLEKFIN